MHLPLLATLLALLTVISANPVERLRANVHVTTLGEGATQPGPILPRGSIIPLEPADHFPSELEIVQSVNAYSMLLVCHFFRQGSFCDSPLNRVDEFLAFTGHLHNVLDCQFKPGGKNCATNENVVVSMYKLFDYLALLPDSATFTSISSSSSTAASSTMSISSSPSTATFPTASVSLAPSPMSTSAILPNSTSLSSSTSSATTTSSSSVSLSSFTSLTTATSLSILTSRHTWISLSTVTSLSTSTIPVPSIPSSTPSTSLSNPTVTVPSVPASTPPISLVTLTLSLTSTVRVSSVPSSTPFFNGTLTMKRTVQRAEDSERKPLAQENAAQPDQLDGTMAAPGNDSTSDISSSFERKGALPGIMVNAAANAITATVQDAVGKDEQEHAKNGSEGKDKKELKITRGNTVASGNVTDVVFGVIEAMGVAQQEQN